MSGEGTLTRLERFGWRGAVEPGVARVVSAHGDYLHLVANEAGGEILARRKKSLFSYRRLPERNAPPEAYNAEALNPITGDFVRYRYNAQGESLITGVLPRWSHFVRKDPTARRKAQTLAVNFDTLFVTMAMTEDFSLPRLARFLALSEEMGEAGLVVVLTKADLVSDAARSARAASVEALGACALVVSAVDGTGMDAVRTFVAPRRTVAFIGSSGVGKSTLLNALAGEEVAATQAVQSWSGKGRHTTTSRELVMLSNGAMVIDTPGVREVGRVGEWDDVLVKGESSHRYRR